MAPFLKVRNQGFRVKPTNFNMSKNTWAKQHMPFVQFNLHKAGLWPLIQTFHTWQKRVV